MRRNDTERVGARARRLRDRLASVEAELEPRERIVADRHRQVVVTDRRCFYTRGRTTNDRLTWDLDGVRFDEVLEWREGRTHDARPIVQMEHPPHKRRLRVPAHRFLWFRWGNAEAAVPTTSTEVRCSSGRDATYLALLDALRAAGAPEGPPFQERPAGTRDQRVAGGVTLPYAHTETLGGQLWRRLGRDGM